MDGVDYLIINDLRKQSIETQSDPQIIEALTNSLLGCLPKEALPSFVVRDNDIEFAETCLKNEFNSKIAPEDEHFCTQDMTELLSKYPLPVDLCSSQDANSAIGNSKFTPYRPNEDKYKYEELNGHAKFDGTNEQILCRHLAVAVLGELNPVHNKISYEKFSSVGNIAKNVKSSIEAKLEHIKCSATEVHLLKNANWGQFVAGQFEEMHQQGVQTKRMLLESTNHDMAQD
jgi:hypothetical protein